MVFGPDGKNYRKFGDTTFGFNGQTFRQLGNTTFCGHGGKVWRNVDDFDVPMLIHDD